MRDLLSIPTFRIVAALLLICALLGTYLLLAAVFGFKGLKADENTTAAKMPRLVNFSCGYFCIFFPTILSCELADRYVISSVIEWIFMGVSILIWGLVMFHVISLDKLKNDSAQLEKRPGEAADDS